MITYDYLGRDGNEYKDVYRDEAQAICDFLQGGDNASIMELVAAGNPSPGLLEVVREYLGKPVKRPLKDPARDAAVVADVKALLSQGYPLTSNRSRNGAGAAERVAEQYDLETGTVLQIYRRHQASMLATFNLACGIGPVKGPIIPLLRIRKC